MNKEHTSKRLEMSVTQILVVDDSLSWQRFVQGRLESETSLKIIATASDGLEAVRKAADLQPDVVLMDIGLPGMNGFEAARQIRILSSASRILFLSEQRGLDLIETAFEVGGLGYVLKSDSYADLLAGIQDILHGRRFLSRTLRDSHHVPE